MNVIFLGTGDFSQVVLKAIYESRHNVVAVVSQPVENGNLHTLNLQAKSTLFVTVTKATQVLSWIGLFLKVTH